MADGRLYVFELIDYAGGWPFARTTDNGIGTWVFTTAAKALAFASGIGRASEWRVAEHNLFDAKDWLETMKTKHSVTEIWADPLPQEEGWKSCPIDVFLMVVDAMCRKE